ncbi:hypothetical protein DSM43518_00686 [Mycobacterium marinum]|nr:hypothetical protein MM1218R_01367 [Mycobacterium marinum]CDM75516.1 hypothetical protein MMARE11_13680 [Mycobacterium marinum E11]AXN48777.1 hypothetical protein CCUG20998_01359 [Mycobacterium marinum]RFZ11631.1 hypothetical protein DE4381_01220 [Mycobacterium marinum]RFZ12673.1 hypothetical protein VIMS_03067 [Mycobacterium marinum]
MWAFPIREMATQFAATVARRMRAMTIPAITTRVLKAQETAMSGISTQLAWVSGSPHW